MWTLGATYLSTVEEIPRPLLKCNPFQGMSIQESKDSSELSAHAAHWLEASQFHLRSPLAQLSARANGSLRCAYGHGEHSMLESHICCRTDKMIWGQYSLKCSCL